MHDQSHRAVVFSSKVEYIKMPSSGEQRKVEHKPRVYDISYPNAESVPKTDQLVLHRAQVIARQLHEVIQHFDDDQQPRCRFK